MTDNVATTHGYIHCCNHSWLTLLQPLVASLLQNINSTKIIAPPPSTDYEFLVAPRISILFCVTCEHSAQGRLMKVLIRTLTNVSSVVYLFFFLNAASPKERVFMQVLGSISGGWWHHYWTRLSYHKQHCSNMFFWKCKGQIPFFKGIPPLIQTQDRAWARHWRLSLYQYTTATMDVQ